MGVELKRSDRIRRVIGMFPPGRLVDLGAGHGGYARLAADLGWQVTAVDARTERFPENDSDAIEWRQSDIRDVDLEPYDLVLCLGVFYHLTVDDQIDLLSRCRTTIVIDTHVDHGVHDHHLSERVTMAGYEGRLYQEHGETTSSWGNDQSFWPTLESFHRMLNDWGFPLVLTMEPWLSGDRTVFVALR